jgi:predicted DNA-binding transcriptional regulator AlpA
MILKHINYPDTLLLSIADLAKWLSMTEQQVHNADVRGELPTPIKLSNADRWSTSEIEAWVKAGCPNRITWDYLENRPKISPEE